MTTTQQFLGALALCFILPATAMEGSVKLLFSVNTAGEATVTPVEDRATGITYLAVQTQPKDFKQPVNVSMYEKKGDKANLLYTTKTPECPKMLNVGYGYGKLASYSSQANPICSCTWSEKNKCPQQLQVESPASVAIKLNAVFPSLDVPSGWPYISAEGVQMLHDSTKPEDGAATNGCVKPINAAALKGKICVVDRGTCFFQTKADFCADAGGLAIVIVDRGDTFEIDALSLAVQIPTLMVNKGAAQAFRDAMASGQKVTLALGAPVGPDKPVAGVTDMRGMYLQDPASGKRVKTSLKMDKLSSTISFPKNSYLYLLDVSGALHLYQEKNPATGDWEDLGVTIPADKSPWGDLYAYWVFYHDDIPYVVTYSTSPGIHVVSFEDFKSPKLIATFYTPFGEDDEVNAVGFVPPSTVYVSSRGDVTAQHIYDVSDPANPTFVKTWHHNLILPNAENWVNSIERSTANPTIVALAMGSEGVAFVDVSDTLNPAILAHWDPIPEEGSYLVGIMRVVPTLDGDWLASHVNGTMSGLRLSLPCAATGEQCGVLDYYSPNMKACLARKKGGEYCNVVQKCRAGLSCKSNKCE